MKNITTFLKLIEENNLITHEAKLAFFIKGKTPSLTKRLILLPITYETKPLTRASHFFPLFHVSELGVMSNNLLGTPT